MSRLAAIRIVLGVAIAAMWLVPAAKAADEDKGPPLPFHSIEGYGGGAITPMAYLVNPGPQDCVFGKPALALTVGNLGDKQLQAITLTETVYDRIEFGYAADRASLGDLHRRHRRTNRHGCGNRQHLAAQLQRARPAGERRHLSGRPSAARHYRGHSLQVQRRHRADQQQPRQRAEHDRISRQQRR